MKCDDFLVEILTEELPPKSLLKLGQAFQQQITERLQKANLEFASAQYYATPRRLAVYVKELSSTQPDKTEEKRGPALKAAYDDKGKPTKACEGFATSCGVTPDKLHTIKNNQGEWVGYTMKVKGQKAEALLPDIVNQALKALPVAKRMRWGDGDTEFVRPIHSALMLLGKKVVKGNILGCEASNVTQGHRFLAPKEIKVSEASAYLTALKKAFVLADVEERRDIIKQEAIACVKKQLGKQYAPDISDELLNEVTGLVEWPVALCGHFDEVFLKLPDEAMISSMQDHQRYFPVRDEKGKLHNGFVTISNIQSKNPEMVVQGNERVIRARLSDAAFFYEEDKKESLEIRIERLRHIVNQEKLGTLFDKAERLSALSVSIAKLLNANVEQAARAGLLAKTDLTTSMVNEFPELQGVMGGYYAQHDKEPQYVALAIVEQYMPRFAGDKLPQSKLGQVLALADKIDALVGLFGINQLPTGDKDPFGLRRAAIGVLRVLIENNLSLDLREVFSRSIESYGGKLTNPNALAQLIDFMQERMRVWSQEQQIAPDVFAAVAALQISNPLDAFSRIKAVQAFKKLRDAEVLAIANKRVSNILAKYKDTIATAAINPAHFEHEVEKILANELEAKSVMVTELSSQGQYDEVLIQLADLRQPIDEFFDKVLVMTDDKDKRENRILILTKLRSLFLRVADIALLGGSQQ